MERYAIRPIAVEPTYDGLSAIVTTLMQLPGGKGTPVRMTLASALVSIRGPHHLFQNLYHYNSNSNVNMIKAAIRRRTNHLQTV